MEKVAHQRAALRHQEYWLPLHSRKAYCVKNCYKPKFTKNGITMISCVEKCITLIILLSVCVIQCGDCVRCYQCSSSQEGKDEDNCGAYAYFDKEKRQAVECFSDNSVTPGTFCVKITKQGPKGFIWDGRWRQVIRRCGFVSDTGVTNVCNWGIDENSVYWEECYCPGDECNSSVNLSLSSLLLAFSFLLVTLYR